VNIISFVLAIVAVIVFVLAWKGAAPWAHLGLGLALFTTAFIIQLTWVTTSTVHFG
jgi:hypothetical protein